MPEATKTAAAPRAKQTGPKRVTLDQLKSKPAAVEDFTLYMNGDKGEQVEVTLQYRAIGANDYDKLVAKHPPKAEQRVEGASFDINTFAPALIARVAVEPEMTYEDAKEIWDSPEWSRGDLMVLFRRAVDLCNRGLDIPFTERG